MNYKTLLIGIIIVIIGLLTCCFTSFTVIYYIGLFLCFVGGFTIGTVTWGNRKVD